MFAAKIYSQKETTTLVDSFGMRQGMHMSSNLANNYNMYTLIYCVLAYLWLMSSQEWSLCTPPLAYSHYHRFCVIALLVFRWYLAAEVPARQLLLRNI